ncbi:MAG: cobalamin-binding protein [Firmicutes bacterium]|nr:cobalamin-binding protein [Bacillota bacterium]
MKKRLFLLLFLVAAVAGTAWAAPQRIVSLAPSITENLFALGVGDRVVGVTSWCDYPEEAKTRAIVGDAISLNLEVLLSLEPDLVVGDATLVQSHLDTLQSFGIPVFVIAPATISEIQTALIELGEAVGAPERGEELALAMEARLAELVASVQRSFRPRVWIEVWHDPLMTAGPGSFMHELIELAGGENIAGDADSPWPIFSEELVIERDPQVVLLTAYNLAEALSRPAWQATSAYQNGCVYEVNPDIFSRTTPRILDALAELITIFDEVQP